MITKAKLKASEILAGGAELYREMTISALQLIRRRA